VYGGALMVGAMVASTVVTAVGVPVGVKIAVYLVSSVAAVSRRGSEHRRAPGPRRSGRSPEERSDRRGEQGQAQMAGFVLTFRDYG
jgi:hypothetical protein